MKGWNTYSDTCDGVNTDVMRWILTGLEMIMRAHSLHESPTFVHCVQQVWEKEQSSRWLVASDTHRFTAYNPILYLLYCIFNNHRPSLHVERDKMIQKAFPLVQIKLNDITPKILDNVSGSLHQLNEYLKLRFLNSVTLLTTILQRSCQHIYKTMTPFPKKSNRESSIFFTFMHIFRTI